MPVRPRIVSRRLISLGAPTKHRRLAPCLSPAAVATASSPTAAARSTSCSLPATPRLHLGVNGQGELPHVYLRPWVGAEYEDEEPVGPQVSGRGRVGLRR